MNEGLTGLERHEGEQLMTEIFKGDTFMLILCKSYIFEQFKSHKFLQICNQFLICQNIS